MHRRIGSDTFAYICARGIPGIVAFLAIPIFANLLQPQEYGTYAIMTVGISVANSFLFQWIRVAIVRCYPADRASISSFKSTVATLWLAIAAATAVAAIIPLAIPSIRPLALLLLLGWILLATQSLFDLVSEFLCADLRPWHFMGMQLTRASSMVGFGVVLLRIDVGWVSPLIAVTAGMGVAIAWAWHKDWRGTSIHADRGTTLDILRYGLPVSLTVGLVAVIFLVDRSLIAVLLGRSAAGVYSVAFDFASQTITLVMTTVSLAAFPIVVRQFESGGVQATQQLMSTNASMLLALGVPATVGAGVLAPGIADTFFDSAYAESSTIIPLIAVSALLAGLKAYHFDATLQLTRRTTQQVWIVLAATILSVILNVIMIPVWGLQGAGVASALTFLSASAFTAWWGRRYFPLPFPIRQSALIILASAVMGGVLYPFRDHTSSVALLLQVVAGSLLYGSVLIAIDGLGLRRRALRLLKRRPEAMTTNRGEQV